MFIFILKTIILLIYLVLKPIYFISFLLENLLQVTTSYIENQFTFLSYLKQKYYELKIEKSNDTNENFMEPKFTNEEIRRKAILILQEFKTFPTIQETSNYLQVSYRQAKKVLDLIKEEVRDQKEQIPIYYKGKLKEPKKHFGFKKKSTWITPG